MSDSLKIFCENTGEYVDIRGGETLLDIAARIGRERLGLAFP